MTARFVITGVPKRSRGAVTTLAALLPVLTGCAALSDASRKPPSYACLLASEQPMLVAELFFGRSVPGRGPVSDAEWQEFAAQVVTPAFPDGFTVYDGEGQWQNPATAVISRQRTKVLVVAARRTADLPGRITTVIDAYKTRFRQQSVGIVTHDSCAAF